MTATAPTAPAYLREGTTARLATIRPHRTGDKNPRYAHIYGAISVWADEDKLPYRGSNYMPIPALGALAAMAPGAERDRLRAAAKEYGQARNTLLAHVRSKLRAYILAHPTEFGVTDPANVVVRFSAKAGCTCPCSPGFLVTGIKAQTHWMSDDDGDMRDATNALCVAMGAVQRTDKAHRKAVRAEQQVATAAEEDGGGTIAHAEASVAAAKAWLEVVKARTRHTEALAAYEAVWARVKGGAVQYPAWPTADGK